MSIALMQVFNLVQTTFILGLNLNISYISIPAFLLSPSPILAIRQWSYMYEQGKITALPLSATSLITSILLAYATMPEVNEAYSIECKLYILSSILSLFIFPFTGYFLGALNHHLTDKAKAQREHHYADLPEKHAGMQTARDHDRIANWAYINWFRVAMFAVIAGSNAVAVAKALDPTR